MKILIIALGTIFGVIYVSANEIGKFIEDINPDGWNDMGEDFDDMEETYGDRNSKRTL